MSFSENSNNIFDQVVANYHVHNDIDRGIENPFPKDELDFYLYKKCWIDTVQWHLEDEIRDPNITPAGALGFKRKIDASNQDRTDTVELLDDYFYNMFDGKAKAGAELNTETPAWAIDRLSILALKIYHMREEAERKDASEEHLAKCGRKLAILLEQRKDLSGAIDALLTKLESGEVAMKTYKQMKMYNDPSLNPVLYAQQNK